MALIHSSYYRPTILPEGTGARANIDRLQDLTATTTLNREKIKEIGRDGTVAFKEGIPSVALSLRQLEYGTMEFWQKLANSSSSTLTLNSFKTSLSGIAAYKTDDDSNFLGTVWYPGTRVGGFSLNIGDPDALAERSFDLVGEDEIQLLNNGKYLIAAESTFASGDTTIVIGSGSFSSYPDPVEDLDNSGQYIYRATRTRSGSTEVMNYAATNSTDLDYEWDNGTTTFTPYNPQSGDIYKIYYGATTYVSGSDPFTENDSDSAGLSADSFSIYFTASDYVYRLQSVNIDVSFDRQDVKEIGNSEVVARGIREKTVNITLGRILEDHSIEEILRGVNGSSYTKIDVRNFTDNNKLIIKAYSNKTKSTFLMGYSFTNLSPISVDAGAPTSDYITRGVTLEGESGTITSSEGSL